MNNLKALMALAAQHKQIPILTLIAVKDGVAYATDLDTEVTHPVHGIPDGMYSPHGFDKEKLRKKESLPIDEFPFNDDPGDPVGSIVVKSNALKFVARAQSTEDTRYYLNGICFTGRRMVATCGHRLNLAHLDTDVPSGAHIIPRGAVKIALSILSQFKKYDVQISFFEERAVLAIGDYNIITKYVDGTYPNFDRVIPTDNPLETEFDASEIKAILPDLRKLVKQNGDGKKVPVKLCRGKLYHYDTEFDIKANFKTLVGFHAPYLADACSGIASYKEEHSPLVITDADNGFLSVVMPMRV